MKKLFTIFIGILFSISIFGQSYIGETKKEILKMVKENNPTKISKEISYNDIGDYSITAKFKENTNVYSFTKNGFSKFDKWKQCHLWHSICYRHSGFTF